jgi:hypothetical protein
MQPAGDKHGNVYRDKYDKGATFWSSAVAIQYARGAGFAVYETTSPAIAERSDMPGTHFELVENDYGRFVWVRG